MNLTRKLLISVMTLTFLNSACNLPAQTPPSLGTELPSVSSTSTSILIFGTPTALIPVTGIDNMASLQCQFCVNDEIHAVLVLPEPASFLVSEPITGINCLTVQIVNGRRVVICRAAQQTSFTLNVCITGSHCSQVPVQLEPCALMPETGVGTPRATMPVNVLPTQVNTMIPTTSASSISTPMPTQPGLARSPFTATPVPPFQPVTTPLATAAPSTGQQDPAGFAQWYFAKVWGERNYQDLWNNYLTPSYKANVGSGVYEDYVAWWNSVERVEVDSVQVLENNGTQARIRVNAAFYMRDGRVVPSQPYEYDLLYDAARGTWMFDYRI
jgi:hypothetical protein